MRTTWLAVPALAAAVGVGAAAAAATAPPVGPLPSGPPRWVGVVEHAAFTVTLPRPTGGKVWRIARPYDSDVVRQLRETTTPGGVQVTFRAVGQGSTRVVFALTRGETAHAYAARSYRVVVGSSSPSSRTADCPRGLLPLPANPISPAVAAALAGDPAKNRPQVVAAAVAPQDSGRGAQARAQCGTATWRRTVVVSIVDRAFLPAQSASQRVLFVGRTKAGWRVWQRAH